MQMKKGSELKQSKTLTPVVIPSVQNPNSFITDLKLLFNLNIKLTTLYPNN